MNLDNYLINVQFWCVRSELVPAFLSIVLKTLAGIDADEAMSIAAASCPKDHYWKNEAKGASEDVFFMSTLDRAGRFNELVRKAAEDADLRFEDIMIYLQPAHQGVSCHIEYVVPYDPQDAKEAEKVKTFASGLVRPLMEEGAYFSRPAKNWAAAQIGRDEVTKDLVYKIKGIFDPHHIMNPGKLGEAF